MTVRLLGCPYLPLGSYLKALAVLRLVSQEDKRARGCWDASCFLLESDLDRSTLVDFFLTRYQPTPVLAPWNAGSSFYPKDRKIGLDAIKGSKDRRFTAYQTDLKRSAEIVAAACAIGDEEERRTEILRRCRNELSDQCVDWLDAAIAISAEEKRAFAPVLGTGGNEGRLDYTNNFMENVARLLIAPDKKLPVRPLLEHALFGEHTRGLQAISVGQYDPGRAGGFNQGEGIEEDSVANPWNAVLTLEGAVAWAGGIYRKQGVAYRSTLCSPFTVRPSRVGFGSSAEKDDSRAEIWTPLWTNPARYGEIRALLREGRAAVEGRPAQDGMEFANAAASLGVDRGIAAFVRYSLLKRRGDSYVALPTGKFPVEYRSAADLIRGMTPFVDRANSEARGNAGEVPNSWPPLRRAVDEAMFQALLHGRKDALIQVAATFGAMHRWLLERKRNVDWRGRLAEGWIAECSEASPEARIAATIAHMWNDDAGPIIQNLSSEGSKHSWTGRDVPSRMIATLRRRTMDGSQFGSRIRTTSADVVLFLEQRLDEQLIEDLLFAFVLAKAPDEIHRPKPEDVTRWPSYCVLKPFFAYEPDEALRFASDLAIVSLLGANRIGEAVSAGLRRLRNAGWEPLLQKGWEGGDGARLGAALLIPVWDLGRVRSAVVSEPELQEEDV